jgi:MoaA/NifB/PqqE/SkfB family radical SAM enzyme
MISKRIRLFTGFECNNACRFCNQGDMKSGEAAVRTPLELLDALPEGVSQIQFTGGESTLNADELIEAIKGARAKNINDIRIQTNGRMLAYGNLVERFQDAGVNAVDISLHGAQAKSHDWITQVPESFRQSIAGIRKAVQAGLDVAIHMVVIKSNFREAPDVAKLCGKLGVSSLHFRMVVSEGWASEKLALPALTPKFSLILPYLGRAVIRAERAGIEVSLHDFPTCQTGKLRDYLNTDKCSWIGLPEKGWPRAERVYPEPCGSCREKSSCVGLTVAYNDYYGTDDLTPIDSEFEAKKIRA